MFDYYIEVIPLNQKKHPSQTDPILYIIRNLNTNQDYAYSVGHPDCIVNCFDSIKKKIQKMRRVFVSDKKNFFHLNNFEFQNVIDISLLSYYTNNSNNFNLDTRISKDNRSIPLMKIYQLFKSMINNISSPKCDSNLLKYESEFSSGLYHIEKNGLYVKDFNLGSKSLVNSKNLVHSYYNLHTPTGRPSNRFGNVNYAALNKKTGERNCFVSRYHDDGLLVMMDFESYHLRLIGNYLKFDLPNTSLHEYLGKLYYGKNVLSENEYDFSKKITFNLLYGGISTDVRNNVPFMDTIASYVDSLWKLYKVNKYVETWFYKRKIHDIFFGESPSKYKVFNYLLQAAETERNCKIISKLNSYLEDTNSKLILYTYDAFLFDVPSSEFHLMKNVKSIMTENDKYPIRTYIGKNYADMREI